MDTRKDQDVLQQLRRQARKHMSRGAKRACEPRWLADNECTAKQDALFDIETVPMDQEDAHELA